MVSNSYKCMCICINLCYQKINNPPAYLYYTPSNLIRLAQIISDAFITEGSGDGRFKQNISIDLFKQFPQDGIRTNGASYLGIV